MQGSINECLPAEGSPKTLDQSIGALHGLQKTPVLVYCGRGVAGQLETILGWLNTMKAGRSPSLCLLGDASSFMQEVILRLALFCTVVPSGGGSEQGALVGKAAIEEIYQDVEMRFKEDGNTINLADMRSLHVYSWLLATDQQTQVTNWTEAVLAKAGVGGKKAAATSADEKPSKVARRGRSAGSAAGPTVVDGYFS